MAQVKLNIGYETLQTQFIETGSSVDACVWCRDELILGGYRIVLTFLVEIGNRFSVDRSLDEDCVIICKNCRDCCHD